MKDGKRTGHGPRGLCLALRGLHRALWLASRASVPAHQARALAQGRKHLARFRGRVRFTFRVTVRGVGRIRGLAAKGREYLG